MDMCLRCFAQAQVSNRWWSILGISLRKDVAEAVIHDSGKDLQTTELAPIPGVADLPVLL